MTRILHVPWQPEAHLHLPDFEIGGPEVWSLAMAEAHLALASPVTSAYTSPTRTRSSAGEHHVDIVGVAGSIPAASTISSEPSAVRPMTRSSTFFICGAPKSGTTWLQAIMNAHPVVSCFGEGHFVEQIAMPLEGLLRNYNAKLKLVSERVYQGEEDYKPLPNGEIVGLTRILLLNLMRRPGLKPTTQWLGDKTPAYAKHLKALNLIFPDCKVFHIVRDPRDVAVSSLFHAKRAAVITDLESETDTRRTLLQNAIGRWKETVNAVNDARELLGPRLMEVRYETLIDAPRETIPTLFAHLDTLGCDEAVLSAILA